MTGRTAPADMDEALSALQQLKPPVRVFRRHTEHTGTLHQQVRSISGTGQNTVSLGPDVGLGITMVKKNHPVAVRPRLEGPLEGPTCPVKGRQVLPVLMRDAEVIGLKEAAFRAGRSEKTISRWCISDGIGRRPSPAAPWEISAVALEAKRYGDDAAIDDLRRGDFASQRVRRYVQHLGLDAG